MNTPDPERHQRAQQRLRLATSRLDDEMRRAEAEDAIPGAKYRDAQTTRALTLALVEHTRALRDCYLALLAGGDA